MVGIGRASVYYQSQPIALELPFMGTGILEDQLVRNGFRVGRKHVISDSLARPSAPVDAGSLAIAYQVFIFGACQRQLLFTADGYDLSAIPQIIENIVHNLPGPLQGFIP